MKPLISYYGGKQRIASKILPFMDAIPHTVYVEPFCGGAALLFAKSIREVTNNDHYREVINDTSDQLINMYKQAILQPEAFENLLKATLYSQSDHATAQTIMKHPECFTPLEMAWAYYVDVQMSFSNTIGRGWSRSVVSRNHPIKWNTSIDRLSETISRIKNAYISCEDALECIKKWDAPQTLFYIDPPYPGANQGHYEGYTMDDWQALCETLDKGKGSYILSNYTQEVQPKSAQQIVNIAASSSAAKDKVGGKVKTRTEVLWICDRSDNMREDLKKIVL